MSASVEAVMATANGSFLVRDVSADTAQAQRSAADAARITGRRGRRLYGVAGAVLVVRCADQFSRPRLRIEVLDAGPTDEPPWQWETRAALDLPTGRIRVDAGDNEVPANLLDIDAGAGPGTYALALGHAGRLELQEAARRVREETLYASADETLTAWRRVDGLERYLIRLWPYQNVS